MSLYEGFFVAQHVSNAIAFIRRSWRLYVGVMLCNDVYVLASCLLVSVYLWVFFGAWRVIIMCPGYVLLSYTRVITYLSRCVLVYWCGSAGVRW